jgi:membrane protein implicated in regulation of membrane protease activity
MVVIGILIIISILVLFVYDLATAVFVARHPLAPYKDEDPVLGRIATVCRRFSGSDSSAVRTGTVELNGSPWQAETADLVLNLDVGDRCRISGRDGLRLMVEAEH